MNCLKRAMFCDLSIFFTDLFAHFSKPDEKNKTPNSFLYVFLDFFGAPPPLQWDSSWHPQSHPPPQRADSVGSERTRWGSPPHSARPDPQPSPPRHRRRRSNEDANQRERPRARRKTPWPKAEKCEFLREIWAWYILGFDLFGKRGVETGFFLVSCHILRILRSGDFLLILSYAISLDTL